MNSASQHMIGATANAHRRGRPRVLPGCDWFGNTAKIEDDLTQNGLRNLMNATSPNNQLGFVVDGMESCTELDGRIEDIVPVAPPPSQAVSVKGSL